VEKRELSEKYSQGTRLGKKKDKKLKVKLKAMQELTNAGD